MDFSAPHPDLIDFEDISLWLSQISPRQNNSRPLAHFETHLAVSARLAIPETSLVDFHGEIEQRTIDTTFKPDMPSVRIVCLRYQGRLLMGQREISNRMEDIRAMLDSHREPLVNSKFKSLHNAHLEMGIGIEDFALGQCHEVIDPPSLLQDVGPIRRALAEQISAFRRAHLQSFLLDAASPVIGSTPSRPRRI